MRVWKAGSGAVAILGAAALALVWAPVLSGQQAPKDTDQDRRIVVRERAPVVVRSGQFVMGGVRLGVSIRDVGADDVDKLKLPGQSGVVVEEVTGESPAAKGGVLKGDVVVSFDGENVRSTMQLTRLVRETPAGRQVRMSVLRDGKKVDLTVAPDVSRDRPLAAWIDEHGMREEIEEGLHHARPELEKLREEIRRIPREHAQDPPGPPARGPLGEFRFFGDEGGAFGLMGAIGRGRLGVNVQDLTPELAEFFGVKDGVLVSRVQADTPAAKAGLKAGDVITAIDGAAIDSPAKLIRELAGKSGEISVAVTRDKKALALKATLEKEEVRRPRIMTRGIGA